LDRKALPICRAYILKPGKSEKKPLRILIVGDMAKQSLCKLALEPEWEARFEINSYGSRPGRNCQDAKSHFLLSSESFKGRRVS
jgi:RNA-directed DNA polymerase